MMRFSEWRVQWKHMRPTQHRWISTILVMHSENLEAKNVKKLTIWSWKDYRDAHDQ